MLRVHLIGTKVPPINCQPFFGFKGSDILGFYGSRVVEI